MEEQYIQQQKSVRQIVRELGASHNTILKYLKSFGIEIRNGRPKHYRKGQLAFGKKVSRGREVEHKRERLALEKMQELRKQGYSYWKTAEILNTMGIPTKTRRQFQTGSDYRDEDIEKSRQGKLEQFYNALRQKMWYKWEYE